VEELREAIAGVIADPYFSIPSEEAKSSLKCARDMIQAFRQPNELHEMFSEWLVTSLTTIIQSVKGTTHKFNKEKMWIMFHDLTISMDFADKWKSFIAKLGITGASPLLYQHLTDVVFESKIKEMVDFSSPVAPLTCGSTAVEEETALSYEEENVVRYVGGYVIRELLKDNHICILY